MIVFEQFTIDELTLIEDALTAIGQEQSLDDFVGVHHVNAQAAARTAYLNSANFIAARGNRHLALSDVRSELKKRNQ